MKGSTVFTVMVIGDNPEDLMKNYDINLKVEPYIKYEFDKAEKIKENSISILNEIIKNYEAFNINKFQIDFLKERLKEIKNQTTFDYYSELVNGLKIDSDGNAWSDKNPNGKWQTYSIGKNFSVPLILKDNTETYQAYNKDVNWKKLHMVDVELYDLVWDMIHDVKKPSNEQEEKIYNNMKTNMSYFDRFKDKKSYITHCCSYWNFAILTEEGWKDIDSAKKPNEWVANFFNMFVKQLKPNDKITIYECTKDKE